MILKRIKGAAFSIVMPFLFTHFIKFWRSNEKIF